MRSIREFGLSILAIACLSERAHAQSASVVHTTGSEQPEKTAQAPPTSLPRDLIASQLEPSYISFGSPGFNIGLLGNLRPMLLFEGNIAPHLSIRTSPDGHWAAVFTPKVVLRMVNCCSHFVEPPSYEPQATFYYAVSGFSPPFDPVTRRGQDEGSALLFWLRLSHHSNGQQDSTYNKDGTVNYKSGQFSTNFAEFGETIVKYSFFAEQFYGFSFEWHPRQKDLSDSDLWGRYGESRIHMRGDWTIRDGGRQPRFRGLWDYEVLYYGTGRMRTELAGAATLAYRPGWSDDFWFFSRCYYGQDYYNIQWHADRAHVLLLGVMAVTTNALRGGQ